MAKKGNQASTRKEFKNIIEHIPFSQDETKHVRFSDPLCETLNTQKLEKEAKTFKKWAPPSRRHFSSDIPSAKELNRVPIQIEQNSGKENLRVLSNCGDAKIIDSEQSEFSQELTIAKKKEKQLKQVNQRKQLSNEIKIAQREKSVQAHLIQTEKVNVDLTPEEMRELLKVADVMIPIRAMHQEKGINVNSILNIMPSELMGIFTVDNNPTYLDFPFVSTQTRT